MPVDGARNFHFLLQCSMRLDAVDREIALDVLKKNGFWAHGENILVAMLADKRQHIRAAWAVDVILRCRQRPPAADDIRQFQPPDILCSAEDYPDMVHPVDLGKTEPPTTVSLTDRQLVAGYDRPLKFGAFPCHSQAVERLVKVVTAACRSKVGHDARHRLILSQAKCRSDVGSVDKKESFTEWVENMP